MKKKKTEAREVVEIAKNTEKEDSVEESSEQENEESMETDGNFEERDAVVIETDEVMISMETEEELDYDDDKSDGEIVTEEIKVDPKKKRKNETISKEKDSPDSKKSKQSEGRLNDESKNETKSRTTSDKGLKSHSQVEQKADDKPKRRISVKKSIQRSTSASEQPADKKRRWGRSRKNDHPQVTISSDSLKDLIEVKGTEIDEAVVNLESSPTKSVETIEILEEDDEEEGEIVEEVVLQEEEVKEEERDQRKVVSSKSVNENGRQTKQRSSEKNEKPNQVVKEKSKDHTERSITPPRNKVAATIHVSNLVRPFALTQLKQLLSENGPFVDDSFWIDNIKSHCFVAYESEEVAKQTRNMLHKLQWPVSSPKLLSVDYTTVDEVNFYKKGEVPLKPLKDRKKKKVDSAKQQSKLESSDHSKEKFVEKRRSPEPSKKAYSDDKTLREWDMHKLDQDSEKKEKEVKEDRKYLKEKEERQQARRKRHEESARRKQEDPPKLLDDLFRKTKSLPCVYWLPHTAEFVEEREKVREEKRVERAKLRKEREETERKNEEERIKERELKRKREDEELEKRREERRLKRERERRDSKEKGGSRERRNSRERQSPRKRRDSEKKETGRSADRKRRQSSSSSSSSSSSGSDSDSSSGSSSSSEDQGK